MLEPIYKSQLTIEAWEKINFYWAKDSRLNFFGCNTAYYKDVNRRFTLNISKCKTVKDIIVSGQSTSSFPSFFPNRRFTSVARSLTFSNPFTPDEHDKINFTPSSIWDIGPTYMVGGNQGEGKQSLNRDKYIEVNKMLFYKNTLLLMNSDQSTFNDHRVDRKDDDKSEEYSKLKSWKTYGFI